MSYKTQMHDGGESYSGVVPAKQPNESLGRQPRGEKELAGLSGDKVTVCLRPWSGGCGGKAVDQGERGEPNSRRTQSRVSEPNGLDRVRQAARKDKELQFTTLTRSMLRNLDLSADK